jgi:hemerythrin-like domain-containing protein
MTTTTAPLSITSDMVTVHRVFRREFRLLPRMVQAVTPGDTRRAAEIARHATELTAALHEHHGEDELLWPKLTARAQPELVLIERMEDQHERLASLLVQAELLRPLWQHSADPAGSQALAGVLTQISAALDEHLADEEEHILPLAAQHVTQDEWDELGHHGIAAMPKSRLLVFFGYIMEEATPSERARMMAKMPAPARLAYRVAGERISRRTTARLRRDLT